MGTFWLFTVITVIGGIWAWVTIPETAGRSLEGIDELFKLPWYKIGLHGQKEAELNDAYEQDKLDEKKASVQVIERVG